MGVSDALTPGAHALGGGGVGLMPPKYETLIVCIEIRRYVPNTLTS